MISYIGRRLLLIIPTLLLVTLLVFFSVRFIPGDVIDMMVAEMGQIAGGGGAELSADTRREALGLDDPVHIQYGKWLGILPQDDGSFSGALQGDFGTSLWKGSPVVEEIV